MYLGSYNLRVAISLRTQMWPEDLCVLAAVHAFGLSWLPEAPEGSGGCRDKQGMWAGPAFSLTLSISALRKESPQGKLRLSWTQ